LVHVNETKGTARGPRKRLLLLFLGHSAGKWPSGLARPRTGRWIGTVEAESGEAAIALAAERFGYRPSKLMVIRRR